MPYAVRGLTKGLVAVVLWRPGDTEPRAVLIRSRIGNDGRVSTFGIRQVTAATLHITENITNDPETADTLLHEVVAWKKQRDDLFEVVMQMPDFPPTEFEASTFEGTVARLETLVSRLRENADDLTMRFDSAMSSEALAYLEPTTTSDAVASFTFNRRSGLYGRSINGESIIGLPLFDDPSAEVRYFHVTGRPWKSNDRPDITLSTSEGPRNVYVKAVWPVPTTNAVRPRRVAAAIAALEARYNNEPVSARFAAQARALRLPAEDPNSVHRLIRSVIRLMLNPSTIDHVRFLTPREVNFENLVNHMGEREPFEAKLRKKK